MLLKTLLNRCHKFKSFVYRQASFREVHGVEAIVVRMEPRQNSRPICSKCNRRTSTYDHRPDERLFRFIPLWGWPVFLEYRMRRVNCPSDGVVIESLPWAKGKSPVTCVMEHFLAQWARKLSWKEVAQSFEVSWQTVYRSVRSIVDYGLKHRSLENINAIGIDEVHFGKGHKYLTVVYQIDQGTRRLLSVTRERTQESLREFFKMLNQKQTQSIQFVCSDMWKPYLNVIGQKLEHALHVLDRFHIVANLNKAINEVRAAEARKMRQDGYQEVLKHTKYCFLKRRENLTPKQKTKLNEVLQYDLKSVRAFLLKEAFEYFWNYTSPHWAQWYLKKWCARAMRSRLKPIKKFARSLRKHEPLILNWFRAKKTISSGVVEARRHNFIPFVLWASSVQDIGRVRLNKSSHKTRSWALLE
jgi:transposase